MCFLKCDLWDIFPANPSCTWRRQSSIAENIALKSFWLSLNCYFTLSMCCCTQVVERQTLSCIVSTETFFPFYMLEPFPCLWRISSLLTVWNGTDSASFLENCTYNQHGSQTAECSLFSGHFCPFRLSWPFPPVLNHVENQPRPMAYFPRSIQLYLL